MRLILQHTNVRATDRLDAWIEHRLRSLLPLLDIEEARLQLEYRHEASPPYHASAHLVIPGPDIRVDVVDHTARTALAKLLAELEARAVERATRRARRHVRLRPPHGFARFGLIRA